MIWHQIYQKTQLVIYQMIYLHMINACVSYFSNTNSEFRVLLLKISKATDDFVAPPELPPPPDSFEKSENDASGWSSSAVLRSSFALACLLGSSANFKNFYKLKWCIGCSCRAHWKELLLGKGPNGENESQKCWTLNSLQISYEQVSPSKLIPGW